MIDGSFFRIIATVLLLALVVPGALRMARGSRLPVLPAILAWLALGGALMLAHGWWTAWQSDVTGPAVLDGPAPGQGAPGGLRL